MCRRTRGVQELQVNVMRALEDGARRAAMARRPRVAVFGAARRTGVLAFASAPQPALRSYQHRREGLSVA